MSKKKYERPKLSGGKTRYHEHAAEIVDLLNSNFGALELYCAVYIEAEAGLGALGSQFNCGIVGMMAGRALDRARPEAEQLAYNEATRLFLDLTAEVGWLLAQLLVGLKNNGTTPTAAALGDYLAQPCECPDCQVQLGDAP